MVKVILNSLKFEINIDYKLFKSCLFVQAIIYMQLKINFVILFLGALFISGSFESRAQNNSVKANHKTSCKIKWYSIDEVIELNKAKKKKIIIDLYTDWCGWCKVMDKNTFANEEIATYINKYYYPVKLDAEYKNDITFNDKVYSYVANKGKGYNQFALEITGGRLSYPSVVFIDEELNVIQPIQGYQEAKEFIKIVKFFGEDHYKKTPWTVYEQNYGK